MKYDKENLVGWCLRATCVPMFFFLWGCAGGAHVVTNLTIPEALVESFPITVGIYYPKELNEYIYDELIPRHGRYVVERCSSQEEVFESSLGAIFEELVTLDSMDDKSKSVDGFFVPEITGVTITIPAMFGTDYFEVWIQYSLQLYDPDGTLIHRWVIPAYGKVNQRDYTSVMERTNQAFLQAAENALRDASTQIFVQFNTRIRPQPVSNWLGKLIPPQE